MYDYDVHTVDFHGLTKKELEDFNSRIKSAPDDIAADNIRWERYELNQAKLGKTPPPLDRDAWQIKADQVRKNQKIGRDRENSARDALSDQLGENLNDNNTGNTCKTRCNDNSSRPDSMNDNYVHEHKHLGGNTDTVYNTKQMETQQKWAEKNGRKHVVTISSDKPLGSGPPKVRPSGPLAESGSDIHYFDAETGKISHTWNNDTGGWVAYGS